MFLCTAAALCEMSTRNRQADITGDKMRATAVRHPLRSIDRIKKEDYISGEGNAVFWG